MVNGLVMYYHELTLVYNFESVTLKEKGTGQCVKIFFKVMIFYTHKRGKHTVTYENYMVIIDAV